MVSTEGRIQLFVPTMAISQETIMPPIYEDGTYFHDNPSWHEEDSPWKARMIKKILDRNQLRPRTVAEIGCGAGEILKQLQSSMPEETRFVGFEISPQAFEICQQKSNERLNFRNDDPLADADSHYDLLLVIDVFEHVDDYLGFLRGLKSKAEYKIFHIPLDLSVQSVFRAAPIIHARKTVGHLHYFTKETALASLKDTGYEIVDYFHTAGSLELPNRGWKAGLLKLPRKAAFSLSPDLAARVLGGFSLLVLAK